jgi:hypothetical protein
MTNVTMASGGWRHTPSIASYLINIRICFDEGKLAGQMPYFRPNYMIKLNINSAMRGYLPISLEKLNIENPYKYNVFGRT